MNDDPMSLDLDLDNVADTTRRETLHQSGGRPYLDVPSGLQMFAAKKKKEAFSIDVVAFRTTEIIKKFSPRLQYADPNVWYGEQTFAIHRDIGVNNEAFACPAVTYGKRCPVCEDMVSLRNSNDKASRDRGFAIKKASERQLYLVLDHDDQRPIVRLWDEAYWNFGKQLDEYIAAAPPNDRAKFKQYYHPIRGLSIRLIPTEQMIGNKAQDGGGGSSGKPNIIYKIYNLYPRQEPLPPELFAHGYDLSSMVRVLDYEQLRRIYLGLSEDEDAPSQPRTERSSGAAMPGPAWAHQRGGNGDSYTRPPQDRPASAPRWEDPPERPTAKPSRPKPVEPPSSSWDDEPAELPPPVAKPVTKSATKPSAPSKMPVEDAAHPYPVGTEVTSEYRGEVLTGIVEKVDTDLEIYQVVVPGRSKPCVWAFDDCRPAVAPDVSREAETDAPPARGRKPANAPPKFGPSAEDLDDEPPAPRRRK